MKPTSKGYLALLKEAEIARLRAQLADLRRKLAAAEAEISHLRDEQGRTARQRAWS